MSRAYDVVVVGGGHNGLVCAAYLVRAGLDVLVLERAPSVGGAAGTRSDLIAGCRIDVGGSVHTLIHRTAIVEELGLGELGLEYLDLEPWGYLPPPLVPGGLLLYRDLDRTCESIARVFSEADAEGYRIVVTAAIGLRDDLHEVFLGAPSIPRLARLLLGRILSDAGARRRWLDRDLALSLLSPYDHVLARRIESPALLGALTFLISQSGVPPGAVGSAMLTQFLADLHTSGARIPRGGSGALTDALAARVVQGGGTVHTGAEVTAAERVGHRWRVEIGPGREAVEARAVVAACHLRPFFTRILRGAPALAERFERLEVGPAFALMVRCAVRALPAWGESAVATGEVREHHRGLQLVCPSPAALSCALGDYLGGRPSRRPALAVLSPTAVDPSRAPVGTHLLHLWAQYFPDQLPDGESWASAAAREADRVYAILTELAPNMRGALIDRYVQSPLEIERTLGMPRGNISHLDLTLDRLFSLRPLPGLANYRTPIPGLFLTGASTHPGSGVFGASGRNTARVVLSDLR